MSDQNVLWVELAGAAGIVLSDAQVALLHRYLDLLIEANQTMNLTRIVDRKAAEILNVGDSLTLLPYLPKEKHTLVDVGSGGGTPAIPVAIARPDVYVTCIEATGKKARFLSETVEKLGLKNVKVLDVRAEDAGQGHQRQAFDVATSKALGTLNWVAEWCLPLVEIKGKMLAMKGPKGILEMTNAANAIRRLGGGKAVFHPVKLPGTDGYVIIEIPKVKMTPRGFPRVASDAKGKALT